MAIKVVLVVTLLLGAVGVAHAAPTDAVRCRAAKMNVAAKYHSCRLLAERKAVLTGNPPNYSRCDSMLSRKWSKAETRYGAACPTIGDQAMRQAEAAVDTSEIAIRLGGGIVGCGNGSQDDGENCDGSDLGGSSCASLGYVLGGTLACTASCQFDRSGCTGTLVEFPATGQTECRNGNDIAACTGTGLDGDIRAGRVLQYVDNGDGTITDANLGLMWEKLSDDGSIHDWNDTYTWADAFASKIAQLNSSAFAGHSDWRLPNVKELQSLFNYSAVMPPGLGVPEEFKIACAPGCTVSTCSCTQVGSTLGYWSSTSSMEIPQRAWRVTYEYGYTIPFPKPDSNLVRAVRGGF